MLTGDSCLSDRGNQFDLLARARKGDEAARSTLVAENTPLVWGIVRRFTRTGHEIEDLFQVGCIGLIKAIDHFDPGFGTQFSTYAVPLIIGEIQRYVRDQSPLKVSRSAKELAKRAWNRQEELAARFGREPTVREIAEDLGVAVEALMAAWEGLKQPAPLSGSEEGPDLQDFLEDGSTSETRWVLSVALQETLDRLDFRERAILILRYMRDKTQEEVARTLKISQAQVSRLERAALEKARAHLKE